MPAQFLRRLETAARSLGDDAAKLADAHWRLARFEIEAALASARRLAVALAVAIGLGVVAMAVATTALAHALDGAWGLSVAGWLAVFAALEAGGGAALGWLGWRRFQREYVGLSDSQAELAATLDTLSRLWRRSEDEE